MNSGDTVKKWLTTKQKAKEEQVCTKTILRRAKKGLYPGGYQLTPSGEWRFPANELPMESHKTMTSVKIALEEEYKKAVIAHFEDLRKIARQWKAQLWLPPPWRWDIADLKLTFYTDIKQGITGYKSPSDLIDSEESKGYFRQFKEGRISWQLNNDDSIILTLSIEDEAILENLKEHTHDSEVWSLFSNWKQLGSDYIRLCSMLLNRIQQDVQRAIGTGSELAGWTIYHDSFCITDTRYRCEMCGIENEHNSKFCQGCNLLLGCLNPILKGYELSTSGSQKTPIHIHGWGNIDESIDISRFESVIRGHRDLKDKYRGHDLVETILETEKAVRLIEKQLHQATEALSEQTVFSGQCKACPVIKRPSNLADNSRRCRMNQRN